MKKVKLAINSAHVHLIDLCASMGVEPEQLVLESVERSKRRKYWLVTYSFDVEKSAETDAGLAVWGSPSLNAYALPKLERSYHTVWIRAKDGKPKKSSGRQKS